MRILGPADLVAAVSSVKDGAVDIADLSHAAQGLPGKGSLIRRGERKDDAPEQ